MGLLDDLRMSTGLALEPAEAYTRAYEKGVLLGPAKFGDAAEMFNVAAQKLANVNPQLAQRAAANAHIYWFLGRRDRNSGLAAVQLLMQLTHIEVPGTAEEIMEAPKLASELNARMLEEQVRATPAGHWLALADAFRRAAQGWLMLLDWRPVTYGLLADDAYTEDGMTRFFLNSGFAAMNDGFARVTTSPDEAAEHFALAAQAFGRCGAAELRASAREKLRGARLERCCWFCGRRAQGLGDNLFLLAASGSEYFGRLARQDRERGESYEHGAGVYACGMCTGAVDRVAEVRAEAVRRELSGYIAQLTSQVAALERRMNRVEIGRIIT